MKARPGHLREPVRFNVALGISLILGLACVSRALAGAPLTIVNDNEDTVLATIINVNAQPPVTVLSAQPIDGFASISIEVPTDASGNAHIAWSASNTDAINHLCGRGRRTVKPHRTVHVWANRHCR